MSQWSFYCLTFKCELDFNLPEHMFQMNNRAKLFLNPCINVEVMARQAQFTTILSVDLQVTLTYNLHEQMFLKSKQLCQIILKSMHKCRGSGLVKLNFKWKFYQLTFSVTLAFINPEEMFQMNMCAKLFLNPSINVEVMA